MNSSTFSTRSERPSDAAAIEALHGKVFSPEIRAARASFRIREQAPHLRTLSFLTEHNGELIASVRLTPIRVGEHQQLGLLLGPLVVDPPYKGQGFGRALMRLSIDEARKAGWPFVILVGDLPYYAPVGFRRIAPGRVKMPGYVDPERLLVAELQPGAAEKLAGMIRGVRP
jgi:predicted N-acetyltransferase YhbS